MALDDGAEIDPATLPENIRLMAKIDGGAATAGVPPEPHGSPTGDMRELVLEALSATVRELPQALTDRRATHPLEDDLRTGLALNLGRSAAAVFTEAKLKLPRWTANLGGSDIVAVGTDGAIVLIETKWEGVWQCLWDILKLASGHSHPRVLAGYAVYAAKPKEWTTQTCGRLFEPDQTTSYDTWWFLEEHGSDWAKNVRGSPSVHVTSVPGALGIKSIFAATVDCLGTEYEIRAISVVALPAAPLELAP